MGVHYRGPQIVLRIHIIDQLEICLTTYITYITDKLLPNYYPNFENKCADTYMGGKPWGVQQIGGGGNPGWRYSFNSLRVETFVNIAIFLHIHQS